MFRVYWLKAALAQLAAIWIQADAAIRNEITKAAHALEQRLRRDPAHAGESREAGRRITFEPPLVVTFRVDAATMTVTVVEVLLMHRRRR